MNFYFRFFIIVLFLPFLLATACKSQINAPLQSTGMEISECLALFPESQLREPFKIALSPSQADRLLVDKKLEYGKRINVLELKLHDKENNFISFIRTSSDIGLRYDLKLWQKKKQQYLGICQTESEACCIASQLKFYRIENKKLIDVTQEKIPPILLSHFIDPAFVPENEDSNITYYIELTPDAPTIKVHLEVEAIGLSFDEKTALAIFDNIKTKTINLVWEKGKFVILDL